jgi:glycosyltransferase involved in cell wall biosynthesis
MQIGYDAKRFFQNKTGLGNYSRTLLSNLVQYFPANEYHLFAPKSKALGLSAIEGWNQVQTHFPSGIWRGVSALWRRNLGNNPAVQQLDLYHGLSHEIPYGLKKIPSLVTVHDVINLKFPHLYPFIDNIIYKRKLLHACKYATGIACISQKTQEDLIELFQDKIPDIEGKCKVIYQSASSPFYAKNTDSTVINKAKLPDLFMLYVGTINERKRLLLLVETLLHLPEEIHLVVVGNGKEYAEKVVDFINKHALNKRVHFIKNVNDKELTQIYSAARVTLNPSIYEGFGLPVLESLLCGTPVITTASSAMAEISGTSGLYAESDNLGEFTNAIHRVFHDDHLHQNLVNSIAENVSKFQPEHTSTMLNNYYKSIVNR